MALGSWQTLDMLGRRTIPFLVAVALILMSLLPWPLPGVATVAPMPLLATVYYWSVHRTELMPPTAILLLGLLQDILTGGLLGLTAFMLLGAQWALLGQARHLARGPFVLELAGFAVTAATFAGASWLAISIYYRRPVTPNALVFQFLLALCLYPLLNWLLGLVRMLVPRKTLP